ncbi:uncharacterized protein PHALS_10461 [Plasmopara halstedii]|uniref:Uncharacterized protein n=1 Tax=Plasmopara halstedii TaxID=4781 RepID=A0A0P1AHE7_PLAHL|nr:uncharacterized protein PHALS_10461 [Plasmopara halstedii]CEG40249.1 hypothetical protein PHALS_10461 [Plasmopara halstedii]|eukprot:XP_024576618.1 hypothetical protein PHALS_10461 [Plasmopara halstedii]
MQFRVVKVYGSLSSLVLHLISYKQVKVRSPAQDSRETGDCKRNLSQALVISSGCSC